MTITRASKYLQQAIQSLTNVVDELKIKVDVNKTLDSEDINVLSTLPSVLKEAKYTILKLLDTVGFTNEEIAKKLDITPSRVSQLLNSKPSPSAPREKIDIDKVAAAIETVEEYSRNLEVYEDTEEVVNALAGIYNDASLDDCVDKYALGEAITHLRGLYEVTVDFSTKMNTALDIDTKQEDNETEE